MDDGENIVLMTTRDRCPLMFRQQVENLWAWPRRGKEQARHLRITRLPY